MRVNFFEEYPNKVSLAKAALVGFPSTVFLASPSVEIFNTLAKQYKMVNPRLELAYWPILPKSYWVSVFSFPDEILNLTRDLESLKPKTKVLIDLELPGIHKNLYLQNLLSIFRNNNLIIKLFKKANHLGLDIFTAEKATTFGIPLVFGLSKHTKIYMYYTSCIKIPLAKWFAKRFLISKTDIGLGTIAKGVLQNEPILSPNDLKMDLNFAKQLGIKTVTIFRLGGLDEKYLSVILNSC